MPHGRIIVERGHGNRSQFGKITITVDSGASGTVLPPHMLRWVDLVHIYKVGAEDEVANGKVVRNRRERTCLMRIGAKSLG